MHDFNSFITLTYSDDFLPSDRSLCLDDFQRFMKRLRKHFTGTSIRFFHCGEYGDRFERPHYHACIFGIDFSDRVLWKEHNDQKYFVSKLLGTTLGSDGSLVVSEDGLWPFGISVVGNVTFESAAYVARYIMKKVTGERASDHYSIVDRNGETIGERRPEYVTMSRRPGIGKTWYEKYKSDVYPSGFMISRGRKVRPPKFFAGQFEIDDPTGAARAKAVAKEAAAAQAENCTPERLAEREVFHYLRSQLLTRGLDDEI